MSQAIQFRSAMSRLNGSTWCVPSSRSTSVTANVMRARRRKYWPGVPRAAMTSKQLRNGDVTVQRMSSRRTNATGDVWRRWTMLLMSLTNRFPSEFVPVHFSHALSVSNSYRCELHEDSDGTVHFSDGLHTPSHRECGQFRRYVHENFEKFKIISTPTGGWIPRRDRPEARSNLTARRGRNYLEFFKILMNIGTELSTLSTGQSIVQNCEWHSTYERPCYTTFAKNNFRDDFHAWRIAGLDARHSVPRSMPAARQRRNQFEFFDAKVIKVAR